MSETESGVNNCGGCPNFEGAVDLMYSKPAARRILEDPTDSNQEYEVIVGMDRDRNGKALQDACDIAGQCLGLCMRLRKFRTEPW